MRVILSIGHGRLHLISSAFWIAKAGVSVRLICGWVPQTANGMLVRMASRLVGRDLSQGFRKRIITQPNCEVCSCAMAEWIDQFMRLCCRLFHLPMRLVSSLGWRLFGWQSCRFIKGADIFHCRSGAGRGGAIKKAKRLGMKVVVDHSIAHPAFMDKQLRSEYEKNGAPFDLGLDSPFWRQIVKDCEESDVVLVNSTFVRDTFLENGFDPEKIRVVYLGQREDFLGLRHPKPGEDNQMALRLLFTGGFGFRKGGEYILSALKILKQRGIPFIMDVVGDYSSARTLISKYEDGLDIQFGGSFESQCALDSQTGIGKVIFHGPKPQDELKLYLEAGDVYVFPSLAEGCAQSGMEAMAAGLCVIGTHESGFPITDGENGCLVSCKNAYAIADKIEWLDKNRGEIDRMGENATRLVRENFTWRRYAENVKSLYEELMA